MSDNSADGRASRVASTRDAAWNMLDDLGHMREALLRTQPTTGDIRRLSAVLRRLLIDNGGDLNKIAPPRLGHRMMIRVPDFKSSAQLIDTGATHFASFGGAGIFGSNLDTFLVDLHPVGIGPNTLSLEGQRPSSENELKLVEVSMKGFLSQKVTYCEGRWFSRVEVLKYVANEAGGVHSGNHADDEVLKLRRARKIGAFFMDDNGMALRIHPPALFGPAHGLDVARYGVDFVMMQVFSAAKYLTSSPDIIELEGQVAKEFS